MKKKMTLLLEKMKSVLKITTNSAALEIVLKLKIADKITFDEYAILVTSLSASKIDININQDHTSSVHFE